MLVEAKVVEVSGGDRTPAKKAFAFTSYGFSQVDAATGAQQIVPGLGFNGTLVDPSMADVVVGALSTHRRANIECPRRFLNFVCRVNLRSTAELG